MRRDMIALLMYLVLFGIVAILSIYQYFNSIPILEIGMSSSSINLIVFTISMLGMAKSLYHLFKF